MFRSTPLFIGTYFIVAVFTIFATSNVDDCRYSPQNIFNAKNFNPHKKPISLLNVPICTHGMQWTWWPEASTIIVTGPCYETTNTKWNIDNQILWWISWLNTTLWYLQCICNGVTNWLNGHNEKTWTGVGGNLVCNGKLHCIKTTSFSEVHSCSSEIPPSKWSAGSPHCTIQSRPTWEILRATKGYGWS